MGRTDTYGRAVTRHCIDDPNSYSPLATNCVGGTSNAFIESAQKLTNFSLSISTAGAKNGRLNANGVSTSVRCYPGSQKPEAKSFIPAPTTLPGKSGDRISVAEELAIIPDSYGSERLLPLPMADDPEILNDGKGPWFRANIQNMSGTNDSSSRLVWIMRITADRYVTSSPAAYAKSEVSVEIQTYSDSAAGSSRGKFVGSVHVVLSRSECGIGRVPTRDFYYNGNDQVGRVQDQPRFTKPFFYPGQIDRGETGEFTPATVTGNEVAALNESEASAQAGRYLPSTTTLTSPLENSTAPRTTTSAPPNPSGEDESPSAGTSTASTTSTTRRTTTITSAVPTVAAAPTNTTTPPATKTLTSTSAAPAVVIPDEPGTLSPTARLEDVGVVTVSGEAFAVVVQGTTVPTDGQQGLAALEIWLGGGDPGDTWATFTSTDPAADGWRWAAINQETGAVVYIR